MFFKFYEFYGAIDVHDHYRQGSLAFERHWITRKWYHSFFRTIFGVIITNAFLMYRYEQNSVPSVDPNKDDDDFSTFLGKLAFQMIAKYNPTSVHRHSSSSSSSSSNSSNANNSSKSPAQVRSDKPCKLVSINEYMIATELMNESASINTKPSFTCSDPDCRQSKDAVTSAGKASIARKKTHYFCYECSNLEGDHKNFMYFCSPVVSFATHELNNNACFVKHVSAKQNPN